MQEINVWAMALERYLSTHSLSVLKHIKKSTFWLQLCEKDLLALRRLHVCIVGLQLKQVTGFALGKFMKLGY